MRQIHEETRRALSNGKIAHGQFVRWVSNHVRDFIGGSSLPEFMDPEVEIAATHEFVSGQFEQLRLLVKALVENDRTKTAALDIAETELKGWHEGISAALGTKDNLLNGAIGIITGTQNPLHLKLLELTEELRGRDAHLRSMWSRISGVRGIPIVDEVPESPPSQYYEITKSDINNLILTSLDVIQDQKAATDQENVEIKATCASLHSILCALEVKLRHVASASDSGLDYSDDDLILQRIQGLIDELTLPTFSEQFIRIAHLNEYFRDFPTAATQQPKEYLPPICEKYLRMEQSIGVLPTFIGLLDMVLNSLTDDLSNPRQFALLQQNVNGLHEALQPASQSITIPSVFIVVSRFVSLVQSLMLQLGYATKNELRIV
jgi:hypothetical protein